jgi:hypothetical protein
MARIGALRNSGWSTHKPVPTSLLVSQPMMAFLLSEKLLSLLASRSSFKRRFEGSPVVTKPS